jgi:hypothetical protein
MKTDALKLELIQWLATLEDKQILQSLFFYKKINGDTDWWDNLTEEQLKDVEKGLKDIKAGNTKDSKSVWEKYGRKPSY